MTDLVDDGTTLTLEELLEFALLAWQKRIRVALPARVRSFDSTDQTVEVELMVSDVVRAGDGSRVEQRLPIVPDVPVVFPRGGQFYLTFPLASGDTGQVVLCDRAIAKWRSTGNGGDPGDLRMHSLAGAVFYPGLAPDDRALSSFDTTSMAMGREDGPSVHVTATDVRLGSASAADAVALSSLVEAELTKIQTTLASVALNPSTGKPEFTTPYLPGDVSATKVKAE